MVFHFYPNFNRTFYKYTVKTLITRCFLWRLIWVCTVWQCPSKGLYAYIVYGLSMPTCKPVLFDEGEILQKSRIAVPTEIELSLQLKKCPELPTLWSPLCILKRKFRNRLISVFSSVWSKLEYSYNHILCSSRMRNDLP